MIKVFGLLRFHVLSFWFELDFDHNKMQYFSCFFIDFTTFCQLFKVYCKSSRFEESKTFTKCHCTWPQRKIRRKKIQRNRFFCSPIEFSSLSTQESFIRFKTLIAIDLFNLFVYSFAEVQKFINYKQEKTWSSEKFHGKKRKSENFCYEDKSELKIRKSCTFYFCDFRGINLG